MGVESKAFLPTNSWEGEVVDNLAEADFVGRDKDGRISRERACLDAMMGMRIRRVLEMLKEIIGGWGIPLSVPSYFYLSSS
jgi:hypothetical protein